MALRESSFARLTIADYELREKLAIAVDSDGIVEYDLETSSDDDDDVRQFKKRFGQLAVLETP